MEQVDTQALEHVKAIQAYCISKEKCADCVLKNVGLCNDYAAPWDWELPEEGDKYNG